MTNGKVHKIICFHEHVKLVLYDVRRPQWNKSYLFIHPVAEFKEFERRFKFKPRLEYGWFHLKLYQMFQDFSRRLI